MRVVASRSYERRAKRPLTPEERAVAEAGIIARPEAWPVIQGTGGARKARVGFGARGKSGGGRIIYFFAPSSALQVLLDIYAKRDKDDLSHDDKKDIRDAIQEIRRAVGPHGGR
jgi:hypothetical protein